MITLSEKIMPAMDWREVAPCYALGVSDDVYYSDEWPLDVVSKSALADFNRGVPAHYRYGSAKERTASMKRGTVADVLILTPDEFAEKFLVKPDGIRGATNAAIDWIYSAAGDVLSGLDLEVPKKAVEAWSYLVNVVEATGRLIIDQSLYDRARGMRDGANRVLWFREYLETDKVVKQASGFYIDDEDSIFNEATTLKIKFRPDIVDIDGGVIIDLKTCPLYKARMYAVMDTVRKYYYDVQAALYSDGHKAITGQFPEFFFFFIEDEPPYLARPYFLALEDIIRARVIYKRWLSNYFECFASELWVGYDQTPIEIRGLRND